MKAIKSKGKKMVKPPKGWNWTEDRGRFYLTKGKGDSEKPFKIV